MLVPLNPVWESYPELILLLGAISALFGTATGVSFLFFRKKDPRVLFLYERAVSGAIRDAQILVFLLVFLFPNPYATTLLFLVLIGFSGVKSALEILIGD